MKRLRIHVASAVLFVGLVGLSQRAGAESLVSVSNVEDLYLAVNDAANAGAVVVLAPGTYVLSATDPAGSPRPNAGRLELQQDMSLSGLEGDRTAVVIDASSLPLASVTRTGIIRTGRGSNSVEWLTLLGNRNAAGGIDTDLPGTADTRLTVAHVVSSNSIRAVDVRNNGAANAGRRIDAEIDDGDFVAARVDGRTETIRIANLSADQGQIFAVLNGNRAHGGQIGCIVANNKASFATIHVRSNGDTFDENGLGCLLLGQTINGAGTGNSNLVTFEAYGSRFINNSAAGGDLGGGGIAAIAADVGVSVPGTPNAASANTLIVRLWGCRFYGNQNVDFQAWGARAFTNPVGPAGTYDTTTIDLYGVSKFVDVVAVNSSPVDPTGTDTVTVNR